MPRERFSSQLAQIWQLPLLVLSLALFAIAAYLFIDPKPGLSIEQKIEAAKVYLAQERPQAASEKLNQLLMAEQLDGPVQGRIHLMLAEALEMGQRQKRLNLPINHKRIIEQTRLAAARGVKLDLVAYKRMGESYEALGKNVDALDCYRRAMGLDTNKSLSLLKKVIELQLVLDNPSLAQGNLEEYLKNTQLTTAERAWAIGEKAQLLIDEGKFSEARVMLDDALTLEIDPVAQGQLNYRLGYCAFKLGDNAQAERYLRVSREQLKAQHPLDADACLILGRISRDRNDPAQAAAFYQVILVSHPDSPIAPLARLGRGICRIMDKQDDAGLTDLHDLSDEIAKKSSRARFRAEAVEGFKLAASLLAARQNYQGAIEVLAYEQSLHPDPPASFFARLGEVFERRADQIAKTGVGNEPASLIKRDQQARDLRTKAGDAFIAYSHGLTLVDDKGYGDALWRGIDLYDRASNAQRTISALELFVAERPDDPLSPDALLRLGRAYQASGNFDKAVSAFQRNQFRYPNSLAASKSAVPLAQALIAKGPEQYAKAEKVLRSVVENNPLLAPESEEFKSALFELAQLFYRTERFEDAVNRLEEFATRYPNEPKAGQLMFLMGDSYRKSAGSLDTKLASGGSGVDLTEASTARRERLQKAKGYYDKTVDTYRAAPPTTDIDKLYQKLAHFYRADCLYDLGQYADAIQLYDTAAFRYQDDPSTITAYVQIVNAYCALGRIAEAKTANERAKYVLRRIPIESFNESTASMPKQYYEQWLQWTSDAGLWSAVEK